MVRNAAATLATVLLLGASGAMWSMPASADKSVDVAAGPAEETAGVIINSDTRQALSGLSTEPGPTVEFTAEHLSTDAVKVRVTVGGTAVTASRDMDSGSTAWGAGGSSLTVDQSAALKSVYAALLPQWLAGTGVGQGVDAKLDLTVRLLALASEAPPGLALPDTVIDPPTVAVLKDALSAPSGRAPTWSSSVDSCIDAVTEMAPAGSAEERTAIAACQVSNNNGLLYFPCTKKLRYLNHDADGHCFLSEQVWTGPGTTDCMGECGPGCNGLNFYTQDCGDHDRCGRVHGGSLNPLDPECGDEYRDAADDFLNGWPRC